MKYERLTFNKDYYGDTIDFMDIYDRLADFENKIENGTLVELPCKVGDTVYYTLNDEDLFVWGKIVGIAIEQDAIWVHAKYEGGLNMWHTVEDIGKNIFLNKAEAEKRLAELKGEEQ